MRLLREIPFVFYAKCRNLYESRTRILYFTCRETILRSVPDVSGEKKFERLSEILVSEPRNDRDAFALAFVRLSIRIVTSSVSRKQAEVLKRRLVRENE